MTLVNRKFNDAEKNIIFLLLFALVNVLVFWKCSRGIAHMDETFYLTVPYRLFQGDAPFVHEWHLSQMSGLILYPLVSLYLKLNGNLDGIVLFARYVYAVINCLYGAFIYFRLKKTSWLSALCVSLMCTLYVPYNLSVLCYNSMGIMALLSALVLIYTSETRLWLQYTISGVLIALAVLCNPYLAAVYFMYGVFACVRFFRHKDSKWIKQFLFVSLGCVLVAIPFLLLVLSRTSLDGLLSAFPFILNDPEHEMVPFLVKVRQYFATIVTQRMYLLPIYACLCVLFIFCLFDKKRFERRNFYFFTSFGFTAVIMLVLFGFGIVNSLMWSMNIMGLFVFMLYDNKLIRNVFYHFWIPGILYSFCMHMTSNQRFVSVASGATVATVGSVIMLISYTAHVVASSEKRISRLVCLASAALILFQLSSVAYQRYKYVFWDSDIEYQTVFIEGGVFDGIYASEASVKTYLSEKEVLSRLDNYEAEDVLYLDRITWYYLAKDYGISGYSAWLGFLDDVTTIERLKLYYTLNPDKLPDAVLAGPDSSEVADLFCETFNYRADIYENALVLLPIA